VTRQQVHDHVGDRSRDLLAYAIDCLLEEDGPSWVACDLGGVGPLDSVCGHVAVTLGVGQLGDARAAFLDEGVGEIEWAEVGVGKER